jgi:acetyl-CoA carboxylase carboxyltransferase component
MADIDEVRERLTRITKMIGRVVAIDMYVERSGDRLIFVDTDGESIMADGEEIIAATPQEIEAKTFLDAFATRAFRAGMVAKYAEIERSRTP